MAEKCSCDFLAVAAANAPRRFFLYAPKSISEIPMDQQCTEISCQKLERKLAEGQPFFLLDCREPEEHDLVRIEGSTLLPMSQMAPGPNVLAGQESCPIVIYCHHGYRSQRVAAWLREQGFSEVQSLAGGIDAWAEQIDPEMKRY